MTALSYRGYQGSVTWESGVIMIRLLHIDDLVVDHTENAKSVEKTFRGMVDDYLDTCARLGREPKKPFKGSFNVRISPDLHQQVALAAAAAGISLNAWISVALEEKLQLADAATAAAVVGRHYVPLAYGSVSGTTYIAGATPLAAAYGVSTADIPATVWHDASDFSVFGQNDPVASGLVGTASLMQGRALSHSSDFVRGGLLWHIASGANR